MENGRTADGTLTTNDQEKAATLHNFFNLVCVIDRPGQVPEPNINSMYCGPVITDIDLTVEVARKKYPALRLFSATGLDGVHPPES